VCATKPAIAVQCRRDAELQAIEEARSRERRRLAKEKEAKRWADEVAESVGEFYGGAALESGWGDEMVEGWEALLIAEVEGS
jgi:hypothetical protein